MDRHFEFRGKFNGEDFNVPLVHVRADIGIVLGPGLDMGDAKVPADLFYLTLHPARGGSHREEEGLVGGGKVPLGQKNVRVVAHRTVALVHDQERNVFYAVAPGNEIVFHDLRGCKNDGCPLPVCSPLKGWCIAGKHDKRGGGGTVFARYQKIPFEKPQVLLDQRFCGCKHQHPAPFIIEPGCCGKQGDRGLAEPGWQDHHRVCIQCPHGDRELVLPRLNAVRPDQGVGDAAHGVCVMGTATRT